MNKHDRQFRRLAFIQTTLGVAAFCIAEARPATLLIMLVLALAAWILTEGQSPRGLPRPLLNLGALIAIIFTAFEARKTLGSQPVALVGHFTMVLQILILFSKKGSREYTQLAVLSPLQMISASVLPGGVTLAYGLLLVAYGLITLMTAMANQVKRTGELVQRRHTKAAGDMGTPTPHETITGARYRLHRQAAAWAVGLGCGGVAVAVFLAAPRSEQSKIAASLTKPASHQVAGYSDEINLMGGSIGEGSSEPVLNITLTHKGETIGGDHQPWLIRGASLTYYDISQRRWVRSNLQTRNDVRYLDADQGIQLTPHSQLNVIHAQITLRRLHERTLFVPVPVDGPIALTSIKTPAINELSFGTLDQRIAANVPSASVHTYELDFLIDHATDYRNQTWISTQPQWTIGHGQVKKLAQQILSNNDLPIDLLNADAPTKLRAARALGDYLRQHYRYTTENPPAGKVDPILSFLFTHRAGHCELFASGLCALCRSVGIPAGVATGFRASEFNEVGGYYTVRQAHAHAWTEIDLGPGHGWHTLDATPAAQVNQQHAAATGWSAKIRDIYDHIEFQWIAAIITYDRDAQHGIVSRIASFLTQGPDRWAKDLGGWLDDHAYLIELDFVGYIMLGVVTLMLVISLTSLIQLLIARHRRMVALQLTKLPRAQRRGLARQLRFYIAMLEILERHHFVRPAWQSPFGYAKELAQTNPMKFDPVVALTEIFYEIRFGHRTLNDQRRSRIKSHLRHLEHTLAEAAKVKTK